MESIDEILPALGREPGPDELEPDGITPVPDRDEELRQRGGPEAHRCRLAALIRPLTERYAATMSRALTWTAPLTIRESRSCGIVPPKMNTRRSGLRPSIARRTPPSATATAAW